MQPGEKIGAACIAHPGDIFKKQKMGESFQTGLEALNLRKFESFISSGLLLSIKIRNGSDCFEDAKSSKTCSSSSHGSWIGPLSSIID